MYSFRLMSGFFLMTFSMALFAQPNSEIDPTKFVKMQPYKVPPSTIQPMSPNDFRGNVNQLSQQNQTALTQKLNKQLAPQTPPSSSKAPALQTNPYQQGSSSASSTIVTQPSNQPTPANNQPYTGFQNSNPTNASAPASGSPKSGWDIKY